MKEDGARVCGGTWQILSHSHLSASHDEGGTEENSVANGDIMTLFSVQRHSYVKAKDFLDRNVTIPLTCPALFTEVRRCRFVPSQSGRDVGSISRVE